jgi:hypothetical protein
MLAVAAIVLGVAGGLLSGGSLSGIADIRLRYEWAILAAFVAQGIARGRLLGTAASSAALVVWMLISLALAVLLGLNASSPGMLVAASGIVLNLDVVLLNNGMPVTAEASQSALAAISSAGGFYHLARTTTAAPWAGDALPLRMFSQLELLSVGDIVLVVGVAALIAGAMVNATSRCSAGLPSK